MSNCECIFPGIGSQQKINERNIPINIQGKLKLLYHFIVNLIYTLSPRVNTTLHSPSTYNICLLTEIQRFTSCRRYIGREELIKNFFFLETVLL